MSIFRPSNLNKRLAGTPITNTEGSTGNGGQIGPTKTPYVVRNVPGPATLGQSCFGGGSCCAGVFKLTESYCGSIQRCQFSTIDLGGTLVCQTAGVRFVISQIESSTNTQGLGSYLTQAQTASGGCTGWFIPTCAHLLNAGFACRNFWNFYSCTGYWSTTQYDAHRSTVVSLSNGSVYGSFGGTGTIRCARAFRCVTY